jgi:drug/metabolite transporter (DMT)-like permease
MLIGALALAVPAVVESASLAGVSWQSWSLMAYLVVFGTVVPFVWYYQGVQAIGAARASQFVNLVPPLAVMESIVLLGEPSSPALLVGGALVVAGLYLTNRAPRGAGG